MSTKRKTKDDKQRKGKDDKQRKGWVKQIPPALRSVLAWGRWLIRPLLTLIALYSCVFLLQTMGAITYRTRPNLLFVKLESDHNDSSLKLTGRTKPFMPIEVGVNQRILEMTESDPQGKFTLNIPAGLPDDDIWVWVLDRRTGEPIAQESITVERKEEIFRKAVLDLAYYIAGQDTDWLWVAGRASSHSRLTIEIADPDFKKEITTDRFGIFDVFIPFDGAIPPGQVVLREEQQDGTQISTSLAITQLRLEEMPLARAANIELSTQDLKMTIDVQIELPAVHPYFIALAQRYLSPYSFVNASFGRFNVLWNREYAQTLTIKDGVGLLKLTGQINWLPEEFSLDRNSGKGIGSMPLFSTKDHVTLHFNNGQPVWFDESLPEEMSGRTITWRGPIEPEETSAVIKVGLLLPEETISRRLARAASQKQSRSPEKEGLREFVADIETRTTGDFIRQTLNVLVVLIPYAGVLWIARRSKFGSPEAWKPITAMTLILAIWRSWYYLYRLVQMGPFLWLHIMMWEAIWELRKIGIEIDPRILSDIGRTTFWLIFVSFVALVPKYLRVVESRLGWCPKFESSPRSLRNRIAGGAKLAYGIIILGVLIIMTQLNWVHSFYASTIKHYLNQAGYTNDSIGQLLLRIRSGDPPRIFLQFGLLLLFFFVFSRRVVFFWLGGLAVFIRMIAYAPGINFPPWLAESEEFAELETFINRIPWWGVLLFIGLTAYPFLLSLLRQLTPPQLPEGNSSWPHRYLAFGLAFIALSLGNVPPKWFLVVSGVLIFSAIGWLTVFGLREIEPTKALAAWAERYPRTFFLLLLVIALVIVWPMPNPEQRLDFGDLFMLVAELDGLFIYIMVLALIFLMRDHALHTIKDGVILDSSVIIAAFPLFAIFLINNAARWFFIPVPFLVGLLMVRFWLFRPADKMKSLQPALIAGVTKRKLLIQDILNAASAKTKFQAIRKALTKKFVTMELNVKDYKKELESYQQYFEKELTLEEVESGHKSQNVVFAIGETNVWENTQTVIRYGVMLALIPLLIALYSHLPAGQVRYPYPVADLLTFLIRSTASWLLYAFFFGYYYTHLRGNSGLVKGFYMFVALVMPFAIYRLLNVQTLAEMRYFFLWATQIFLFCTLLGLLSTDYRLLRQNGFRLRDLLTVHNLPVLSVYASTVIAALTPTILTVINKGLGDLVKFFLETVLPQVSTGMP